MFEHPDNERQDNDPGASEPSMEAPTVAAAIAIVATWLDLSCERRGALTSSLRTIARIGETDVAFLRLTPKELNAKILGKPSELYGISAPAMATVRSCLRYVMRRLKVLVNRTPLNEPWAALRRRIPARTAVPLTRFFEFHSRAGIAPEAVADATFAECQAWIKNATLCRAPSRLFAQMRYRWNLVARELPDLALPVLGTARCQVRKTVALADMPPELQVDLARMRERLLRSDLDDPLDEDAAPDELDETGGSSSTPRQPLRPITVDERLRHARQAVWALVQTGVPLESIRGLRDLVSPLDNAKQAIKFLRDRTGQTRSTSAAHVAEVLRQIAKHHVGLPKDEVTKIARWARSVTVQYDEMTEKNRRRVNAILTPQAEADLLALPKVLLEEARELLPVSRVLAVSAAKRALLVHLGIFYAFRVNNMRHLRRDRHFQLAGPGSSAIARFLIPPEEVKNRMQIDVPVLRLTSDMILEWEQKFRPLIAAPENRYLFPGIADRPMCRQAFGASLKKIVQERVRCEVNPHLMRHRAAVAYLKKHPGEFEIIRQFLGHKTQATARRAYTGPERDAAFDKFDKSVLEDMRGLKPAQVPKHRRLRGKARPHHPGNISAAAQPAVRPPSANASIQQKHKSTGSKPADNGDA